MVAAAGGAIAMGLMPDEEQVKPEFGTLRTYLEGLNEKDRTTRDGITVPTVSAPTESPSGGTPPGKADDAPNSTGAISSQQKLGGKGEYSVSDMTNLLTRHGMSPENARILGAVGFGESGGRAGIDTVQSGLDPNKSNEYSIGLFQINHQAHGDKLARRGWTADDLRDPDKNAQIAIEVFQEAGNSFRPWSVYQSGAYRNYLK